MNYKEATTTISGEAVSWVRARSVSITNEYEGLPSLSFLEEMITVNPDTSKSVKALGRLVTTLNDLSTTFELLNPDDDSIIGSASYGELQLMLYSLYVQETRLRDAEIVARELEELNDAIEAGYVPE